MADTKISALTDSGALDGTEIVPILQGGANKRSPLSRLRTYILGGLGGAAVLNVGTGTGTVAAGDDARFAAVNSATQQALDAKATPAQITAAINALVNGAPGALDTLKEIADKLAADDDALAALVSGLAGKQASNSNLTAIGALATTAYGRGLLALADAAAVKAYLSLAKGDLGLGNVENTPDASKPVSAAQAAAILAAKPIEAIIVALGDETTAITTGNAKVTMRMPYAFVLSEVRASLGTASSSGLPTVDINEGGTTILSTKLTIDATEKTSVTAATPAVISDANLADDAEITFDIDVAGTGAAGLKVALIGRRA